MGYPPQNEAYVLRPDIYTIISGNVTLLSRTVALVSGNLTLLSGNTALLSRTALLVSGNTDLLTNTAAMAQIMGERRITLLAVPIKTEHDYLAFFSDEAPANAKLWGRVKSDSGSADELYVSVVIIRHSPITNPIPQLTTWPWST